LSTKKKRVYELAIELGVTSGMLIKELNEHNINNIKSHMSFLDEDKEKMLREYHGKITSSNIGNKTKGSHKPSSPIVSTQPPKSDDTSTKKSSKIQSDTTSSKPSAVTRRTKSDDHKKAAPRIIRRTEIFVSSVFNKNEKDFDSTKSTKGSSKSRSYNVSNDLTSNAGLLPGFVRSTSPTDYNSKYDSRLLKNPSKHKENTKKSSASNISTQNIKTKRSEPIKPQPTAPVRNARLIKASHVTAKNTAPSPTEQQPVTPVTQSNIKNELPSPSTHAAVNQKTEQSSKQKPASFHTANKKTTPNAKKSDTKTYNQPSSKQSQDHTNIRKTAAKSTSGTTNNSYTVMENLPLSTHKTDSRRNRSDISYDDSLKGAKKKAKKDFIKSTPTISKNSKFVPDSQILSSKTDVSKIMSDEFLINEIYKDDVKTSKLNKAKKERRPSRNTTSHTPCHPPKPVLTSIKIVGDSITVKQLAEALKKTATEVIKKLMSLGILATLNQELDFDTAAIIAEEFGIKALKEALVSEEDILFHDSEQDDDLNSLVARPPVVVVMGHVDHGKTSLLDAIRNTSVIEKEAGGITQHIGAYTVKINNRLITFLDTPGHEAFTAMRARGAQVTDIAILVVAADDGVMPQTIEAIKHAKAADTPIIVAVNKIDKPGANIDKVKQELTEHGLIPEEWGGDTIFVPISAKKSQNIDSLLEMVLLTADIMELKADPNAQAKGTIIEAKLDKDRGPVATMLIQRGTLCTGNSVITGHIVGRIRAMSDDKGHRIKKAGPSTPVEILGLPDVPVAGDLFYAITDEKVAKQLSGKRKLKHREKTLKTSAAVSLDELYNQIKDGKAKDLNLIIKGDVQGSVEALKHTLLKLSDEEVKINLVYEGVGSITESDVLLAQVSNAIIIAFNLTPSSNILDMVSKAEVDLRTYRIIYNAIDDIRSAMKGLLSPILKEVIQGHAEIRQMFTASGIGNIGGCRVTDGKLIRNASARIFRGDSKIYEGKFSSLKRFKDSAKEVSEGFECGVTFEGFNDLQEGDIIECFTMEEVPRE